MRAYALAKHLPMALLILMLALVPFGTNLVRSTDGTVPQSEMYILINIAYGNLKVQFDLGLTSVNAPTIGCLVGVDIPKELAMKLVLVHPLSR